MKKYVNILLVGFLVFVVGIIALNFELVSYEYVDYLPDTFIERVDKFSVKIDKEKDYKIKKAKYNDAISIEKKVDNSLEDEILVEVISMNTSRVNYYMTSDKIESYLVFSNDLNVYTNDIGTIFDLVMSCIMDKKVYNYNLLKYSKIVIHGNEDLLSEIEIDGYEA